MDAIETYGLTIAIPSLALLASPAFGTTSSHDGFCKRTVKLDCPFAFTSASPYSANLLQSKIFAGTLYCVLPDFRRGLKSKKASETGAFFDCSL